MPETIRLLTADGEFVAEVRDERSARVVHGRPLIWSERTFERRSTNEYREVKNGC